MKAKYRMSLLVALMALLIVPAYLVFASPPSWPESPPTKATIRGPGIKGEVAITDREVLDSLQLGVFEDFNHPIAAPNVKDGYTITRWFYEGSFNFGVLHYYPNADGRGFVNFEDGPQMEGDHTKYNGGWFYASSLGEQAMSKLLAQVAPRTSQASNPTTAQPEFAFAIGAAALVVLLLAALLTLRVRRQSALTMTDQR